MNCLYLCQFSTVILVPTGMVPPGGMESANPGSADANHWCAFHSPPGITAEPESRQACRGPQISLGKSAKRKGIHGRSLSKAAPFREGSLERQNWIRAG